MAAEEAPYAARRAAPSAEFSCPATLTLRLRPWYRPIRSLLCGTLPTDILHATGQERNAKMISTLGRWGGPCGRPFRPLFEAGFAGTPGDHKGRP